MASSRSWPFDEDDRPSGSVRPLSKADLQAILAHLGDDPDQLLASTSADQPVVAVRVRASVGRPGGSAQARWRQERASEWAVWTRSLPWRVATVLGVGAANGLLGGLLVPRLSLVLGALAAVAASWRLRFKPSPEAVAWRRGAAHRPAPRPTGATRLGGLARPGRPRQPGQHRPLGDRPGWGIRDRLQAVPWPPPTRRLWEAVAWPPSPRPYPGSGVVGGRPGRPGPARPRDGRGANHGRPWHPGPLGQGGHQRRAGPGGPTPAQHASPVPGGAGVRAGGLAHRPSPAPVPRRCLTPRRHLTVAGSAASRPEPGPRYPGLGNLPVRPSHRPCPMPTRHEQQGV